MPRGKNTAPEVVYDIMASWAVTDNVNETAKQLNIAESTVRKIVKANRDKPEFAKLCEEKRNDFSKNAGRIINKALNRLESDIDNPDKDIPVNQLMTVIGVLYDKIALTEGRSTQNTEVTFKLPEGFASYFRQRRVQA